MAYKDLVVYCAACGLQQIFRSSENRFLFRDFRCRSCGHERTEDQVDDDSEMIFDDDEDWDDAPGD